MDNLFQLNIVTSKNEIFSGLVKKLFIRGSEGEMEILANHSQLLTLITPGPVWFKTKEEKEQGIVILGGILEVQKKITTILADSIIKSKDISKDNVMQVKKNAEKLIFSKNKKLDYEKIRTELSVASAQLRFIKNLKNKKQSI
jgi:F-type H+-transporting ATPase subunit epsilon